MKPSAKKKIIRAGLIAGALGICLYGGAYLILANYRNLTIPVGEGNVTVTGIKLGPPGLLNADSVHFEIATVRVRATGIAAGVRVLRSIASFKPWVAVSFDSVQINLASPESSTTQAPLPDSLPFPSFTLPVLGTVRIGMTHVNIDTILEIRAEDFAVEANQPGSVKLSVGRVDVAKNPVDSIKVGMLVQWDSSSVNLSADIRHGSDSISIHAIHAVTNLLRGQDTLVAAVGSLSPYFGTRWPLGIIRDVENLSINLGITHAKQFGLTASLQGKAVGLDSLGGLAAQSIQTSVDLVLGDSTGTWGLYLTAKPNGLVRMNGECFLGLPATTIFHIAEWAPGIYITGAGSCNDLPFKLTDRTTMANATVTIEQLSANGIAGSLVTVDSSDISFDIPFNLAKKVGRINGAISPSERWVLTFVDTNVSFSQLSFEGSLNTLGLTLDTRLTDVVAFGAIADSFIASHHISSSAYRLRNALIVLRGEQWHAAGHVRYQQNSSWLNFTLYHDQFGSATYTMHSPTHITAIVKGLHLAQLPYALFKDVDTRDAILNASFDWDMNQRTGRVHLDAQGNAGGNPVQARAAIWWGNDSLHVDTLTGQINASHFAIGGLLNLNGRAFYDLAGLRLKDIQYASVRLSPVRVTDVFTILGKSAPYEGSVEGELTYRSDSGFGGSLSAPSISIIKSDVPIEFQNLFVTASGDSLRLGINIAPPGTVAKAGSVIVDVPDSSDDTPSDRIAIRINGDIRDRSSLAAQLTARGGLKIPDYRLAVRNLAFDAAVRLPFRDPVSTSSLTTDTFTAVLETGDLGAQTIDGTISLKNGLLAADPVRVYSSGGDGKLVATAEFDITSNELRKATAKGDRFAVSWGGDEFLVHGITLNARNTPRGLVLDAQAKQAHVKFFQGPLGFTGTLANVAMSYTAGTPQDPYHPPSVTLSATLDSSLTSYNVNSFRDLQDIFQQTRPVAGYSFVEPIALDVTIETRGQNNRIETDIARVALSGHVEAKGTYPYPVLSGRLSGLEGEIGTSEQAYTINQLTLKWASQPMDRGTISAEAQKSLARSCSGATEDSCTVIARLDGELGKLQFSYNTDCGGAYGAGADMVSLVNSVRRGCYDDDRSGANAGQTVGSQALALLEPQINQQLTRYARKFTGDAIQGAQVSGSQALAADSSEEPVSLTVTTREYHRTRLEAEAGYRPNFHQASPWMYRLSLQWRPPFARILPKGKPLNLLQNNVTLEATVETSEDIERSRNEDEIQSKIGAIFKYEFWRFAD